MMKHHTMGRMNEREDRGLRRVFSKIRPVDLANELGLTRSAVSKWDRVPLERVPAIRDLTGLEEYEIRPDHYRRPAA